MSVLLPIENCSKCPHLVQKAVYTADSFERPFDWFCAKSDNKKIQGYVEWNDEVNIPDWCPLRPVTYTDSAKKLEIQAKIDSISNTVQDLYDKKNELDYEIKKLEDEISELVIAKKQIL